MASFGIAPAWLAFNYTLKDAGKLGFAAVFIFAACGVLRLARFNVQTSLGKAKGNFTGIPIPIAAGALAVFILAQADVREWLQDPIFQQMGLQNTLTRLLLPLISPLWQRTIMLILVFLLALGMVSTFEYLSLKNIKLPRKRPFRVLAGLLISMILFFTIEHTLTLSVFMILYCLHGPIMWLFFKRDRDLEEDELFVSEDDENDGVGEAAI